MPDNIQEYSGFRSRLIASGGSAWLVAPLYNAFRECSESQWPAEAREWCGCLETLLARSTTKPEELRAVCNYFLTTQGGTKPPLAANLDEQTAIALRAIKGSSNG